ncbi:hypothetical protein GQ600_26311 [Phytophthora cactorum]|nr:hypothetical protein GQ600_26311 [Phytophthora cactorum]
MKHQPKSVSNLQKSTSRVQKPRRVYHFEFLYRYSHYQSFNAKCHAGKNTSASDGSSDPVRAFRAAT